jgi:ADP-ribose pyrophosphatase
MAKALRPWRVLDRTRIYRAEPWLALERQKIELPDGTVIPDYHRIDLLDCTGVVAVAEDGRILLQRQYRHGVGRVCLSLPGGGLNQGESPLEAAKRELREETGYESRDWAALGAFAMNGNYGCGTVHFFRARGARLAVEPHSGDLEDTELLLMSVEELCQALARGEVAILAAAAGILLALQP